MMEKPLRSGFHSLEDYVKALEDYVIHVEFQHNITKQEVVKAAKQVQGIMAHLEGAKDFLIKA